MHPTDAGGWGWRPVGVISGAISMQDFERLTAVRADFILPIGKLSRWGARSPAVPLR